MFSRRLATIMLMSTLTSAATPTHADSPIWGSWAPPPPTNNEFASHPTGIWQPRLQLAAYSPPSATISPVETGLRHLARSLEGKALWERQAPLGSNLANKTLLETIQQLLYWRGDWLPATLRQQFELIPLSAQQAPSGHFTGYYTPILSGSRTRTAQFRVPVYGVPNSKLRRLNHVDIADGALANQGLEVAWVADPYVLYIAQVQGSAEIHFTDGSVSTLDYAGDNGKDFRPVSAYLQAKGYNIGKLTHENIGRWLREHPNMMREALISNPRYIFFHETQGSPTTASGMPVIPGHTVAVDSRYIPHGSVLLAELPRVNSQGQKTTGTEWRLLFAQDHGRAIRGNGRFDLYTGVGHTAESAAYAVSGMHRAFLVVRKSG
ncbi:MAG: hypothetical protein BWK73_14850 [Thiothrix lacustris]|uniref:Membrane-bound lytic murein transglycosylase A n=1 Tax=Thiothrix lacustris TaxID=525917 RepID=A0A1Y1QS12_9GAMM|nr:MAG: hypothetical protein BWK73_14850 [Thiothrix lacustris]